MKYHFGGDRRNMGDFGSTLRVEKCRKPYVCIFCERVIPTGSPWEGYRGLWEGEFQTWKACESCIKHVLPNIDANEGFYEGGAEFMSFIESEEDEHQGRASWEWSEDKRSIVITWSGGETKTIPYSW